MIVTLTLNPSVDRSIDIAELTRGAVIRATAARLDPGGKGVNVTPGAAGQRRARRWPCCRCGGDDGRHLVRLLEAEGVAVVAVPVAGSTRSNITLAEPDGTITKINEPGASLSPAELDAVADRADRGRLGHGAAPLGRDLRLACRPASAATFYADLCARLRSSGIKVAVDTSGPALRAAVDVRPDLVKPNRAELTEAVGRPLLTLGDVVDAAEQVRTWGAGAVLASLGADGAVLVDADGVLIGECAVAGPAQFRRRRRRHARRLPRRRRAAAGTRSPRPSRGARRPSAFPAAGCPARPTSTATPSTSIHGPELARALVAD